MAPFAETCSYAKFQPLQQPVNASLPQPPQNGKNGASGLNALPLVARGLNSGHVLAVNQPLKVVKIVPATPQ